MISERHDRHLDHGKNKSLKSNTSKIKNFESKRHKNWHKETSQNQNNIRQNHVIDHSMAEREIKIVKVLAMIVLGVGMLVTIGWIFDVMPLKEVLPHAVNMKFSAAVSFIFSGIILYFIAKIHGGRLGAGEIAVAASGMVIFLFMATLLVSNITNTYTGIESLFVKETHDENTAVLGRPSIPTMIDFILIVIAGILSLSDYAKSQKPSFLIGLAILVSGGLSLIGYATNLPFLYYYIPGWNAGMPIHTSVLLSCQAQD